MTEGGGRARPGDRPAPGPGDIRRQGGRKGLDEVAGVGQVDHMGPGLQGGTMVAFSAKTTVDREAWGLTWNVAVETGGRITLIEGVKLCEASADFVSREVLTEILVDTEEHIDFLETQLSLAKSLGDATKNAAAKANMKNEKN